MNDESRLSLRWPAVVIAAIVLLALGAGGTFFWMRRSMTPTPSNQTRAPSPTVNTSSNPGVNFEVSLTEDAIKRAGIEVAPVSSSAVSTTVRIPGTIEPNAYKHVAVTSLVAGRVTRVLVELGDQVRQGQTLAQVFSPELAEAQTKFLSMNAELDAHERELDRTRKLVEIGAASQQELERLHAEHTAKLASVQSLRSRLVLLGMSQPAIDALSPANAVDAITNVPAPIAGAVTERGANPGLNVDTATPLFTVVDLSLVWVVGALYESDFGRVRVGAEATVTATGYPNRSLHGRVTYIDPQVSPDTRTARVRVEVPNPGRELRLGMYADIEVATTTDRHVVTIPRSAVQTVGSRQVVYVATPSHAGTFVERDVRLGESSGDVVEVLAGLRPGDRVASKGSFFLRAERERLGISAPTVAPANQPGGRAESGSGAASAGVQTTRIIVGDQGYEPSRVNVRAGTPVRLTFVRTSDKTCGTAVVFPSLNIRRELPLNQPVDIEFTPDEGREIQFVCGVNMLRGTVAVQ
jgi:membrane fusion protein, heavy metal efflux system